MTVRQKALKIISEKNCSFELQYSKWDARELHYIEIIAPDNYLFDNELTVLVCNSWQDVISRLPQYELTAE